MLKVNYSGHNNPGTKAKLLAGLVKLMGEEALDPSFEDFGGFCVPALEGLENPEWVRDNPDSPRYIDGNPIYPNAPDAVRFSGNFFRIAHAFCVDTDEPAIIASLTHAIRANQATEAYRAAKSA